MPDIVVHANMGQEVYKTLGLDVDRDVFAFGLLGPDPYLFYRYFLPPVTNRVNLYSSTMHRTHTGEYLMELARRSRENKELFAYLAGFLCHYALDATTHPYINRKAKNRFSAHVAIEHRLDKENGGELRIPPFLPESLKEDVGGAITKIYGWQDAWDKLKAGHRHMGSFYRMITDDKNTVNRILYHSHTKASMLTYRSTAVDDIDLKGFLPLYRRAVAYGVTYVNAARDHLNGAISEEDLKKVIGDRSYIEG